MNRRQKECDRARKRRARSCSSEPHNKIRTCTSPRSGSISGKCQSSTADGKLSQSIDQPQYNPIEQFSDITPESVFEHDLDIRVLDCFTVLLRKQFNVTYGLLQPSYLYAKVLARESLLASEKVPRNVFAVQIHYDDGHYLVSSQKGNSITVYDSLPNQQRVQHLMPQIEMIYSSRHSSDKPVLKYVVPQNQGNSNDCGPFALFNAVTLLKDQLPEYQSAKQSEMRVHLHRCLSSGIVSDFPADSLLSSYFKDQESKHERKTQERSEVSSKEERRAVMVRDRIKVQNKERQRKYREQLSADRRRTLKYQDARHKKQVRNAQSHCERETIKPAGTIQKAARRQNLNESEKEEVKKAGTIQKATHRQNLTESDQKKVKITETTQRSARRQNLTESDRKKVKNTDTTRRSARRQNLTESDRQKVKKTDTTRRSARRQNLTESVRKKVKNTDTTRRSARRQNLTESDRQKVKNTDTTRRSARRQNLTESDRQKVKNTETTQRSARRQNLTESDRQKVKKTYTTQRSARRQNLTESDRQKVKNTETTQRSARRQNLTESDRQKVKKTDTTRRSARRQNLTESDRQKVKNTDTTRRSARRQNLTESDRQKVKNTDSTRRSARRQNLTESDRQKVKNTETTQRSARRQNLTESDRQKVKKTDTTQRAVHRQSLTESEKENIKKAETIQKAIQKNKASTNIDLTLKSFFQSIKEGPVFVCCCCDRFLYKTSVSHLKYEKYNMSTAFVKCLGKSSLLAHEWICITCSESLKRQKMPLQAKANKLQVVEMPSALRGLGNLERQLICKIIPFMKLVALPKGSQHGLKGQVVLVPSDTKQIAAALPRQTADAQVIALNLKRRLSDESAYSRQFICPICVNRAFQYLQKANLHYATVEQNDNWAYLSETKDEQFWNSVKNSHTDISEPMEKSDPMEMVDSNEKQTCQTIPDDITDSEDDVENDNPAAFVQNLNYKRSLSSVTCIYPEDGPSVKSNEVLNIAPAEGMRPTSIFHQSHWETLAFPTLFPTGQNTFHEERDVPISPKKYVNCRLLSAEMRFAENVEYTFQCLHWIETTNVKDTVSMSLKKSRTSDLTVGEIQNKENLKNLFKDDEIFASFRKVRGSPQYWHEMQYDMLAKIRHFGSYTFFVSGSAADFHWPELVKIVAQQYGENLDLEYIQNQMDAKAKRNWLARNPVTVARHIDFIFRKVWKNVILSGLHPIGQILNYDIRKEMQSRGTAHFHSAVHVHGAPQLDKSSDEEVVSFIEKHISCAVPAEDADHGLHDLVCSRQTHHHTRTCKKKKENNCRFHFPKPPSTQTVIARTVDTENKHKVEKARKIISSVMETMEKTGTDITCSALLEQAHVSDDDYKESLSIALKKTTILLARKPNETHVNPYNPIILKALRANMDIQFITDVWACVAYITSYMCKPERNMSDLMRNACKEAGSVKDKLKSVGSVFLKSREVSQHEAIARIIGLPLRESNTPVTFVPTGYQNERTRMLKPAAVLQNMDESDTDIFVPNILDKYAARPHQLDEMCLADFVSNYTTSSRSNAKHNDRHDDDDNDDNDDDDVDPEKSGKTIKLLNGLGQMTKRSTPQVIRYHYVSHSRDSEKYFHRLLILYCPWRQEAELNDVGTYEAKYDAVYDGIVNNIDTYEPYLEQVEQASEQAARLEDVGEIWDHIAPEIHQSEEPQEDPDHQLGDIDNLTPDQISQADFDETCSGTSKKRYHVTAGVNIVETGKYYSMVRSLNYKQKQIHDHIFNWCREMALADSPDDEPSPFHIFLSGGGGVGKSHTVHTVYQTALRELRKPGDSTYLPYVVLTAPTGKAALNISGNTSHSAFHLPVKQKRTPQGYKPPAAPLLNSMRATYCHLKILVIDEVSMVSAQTLTDLDLTLQHVFENEKPFGGIAVLAVGDLLQLDPVADKSVFKGNTKGYGALAPNIWMLFELHELTDIVRQKEDPEFAQLLSRVRVGEQTDKDIQELKNLQYNESLPPDCVGIYLTNALKDQYNSKQLMSLQTQTFTIIARDTKKYIHTRRVSVTVTSTNAHETGGLAAEVQVAEKARYMHTKNTDIEDGLVNGAMGTIEKLELVANSPLKGTLYVKFDDPKVGAQTKKKSKYRHLVPVQPVTATFMLSGSKSVMVERTQFPGTLAWGITTHKAQGSTFTYMVADMTLGEKQKTTQPGQIYTMLSRCKTKKGMKIVSFEPSKIKVNKQALLEMTRLQQHILVVQPTHVLHDDNNITLTYLNTRSLKVHYDDILNENNVQQSDIVCLTETHVTDYQPYGIRGMGCFSDMCKHGCAIYSGKPVTCHLNMPKCSVIESVGIVTSNIVLVCIYIHPAVRWQTVKRDMCDIIQFCTDQALHYKCKNTLLLGDFNLEFKVLSSLEKILHNRNLAQLISAPTHRLGAILDLVITDGRSLITKNYPVYFSDHHLINVQIPQHTMQV